MRKHQQEKILESLGTLKEAQKALRKQEDQETIVGLLNDCQTFALSIAGFIESLAGEGTKTVALLAEYCELLYQVSIKPEDKKLAQALRSKVYAIEQSVEKELKPDRIEVVFFPYQLSMFDSLESVYLAAEADPQCDAYVVPIPYYELNPDGSFGIMHYDGDLYPESIPISAWQAYDVEERHPDIIYIHYPYDDKATNASIHPDFYSARLREHCEKLVYIPYFVAIADTVEAYNAYLPGVLHAHKVVVESETIRQSYIGHYKEYDQQMGWRGKYGKAEDKFVAIGSPKYDKVLNSKREDFEISEAWQRLIVKPDDTRKTVILYNTHMFNWLNRGEVYFEKLRYIFRVFRAYDDVVLWWRPHPNTELNFRTQRPELLGEYLQITSDYQREGWGIYDNSPDIHRAIAWSDVYFGDGSSLVPMYQMTGKPVMIQNLNEIEPPQVEEEAKKIWLERFSSNLLQLNAGTMKDATLRYYRLYEWIYYPIIDILKKRQDMNEIAVRQQQCAIKNVIHPGSAGQHIYDTYRGLSIEATGGR